MCRASRRLAQEPPLLSSDEEDDKEFIGILERNREEREFDRRNDEEANMNPRQAFLQQIQGIISQNERRRNILGQLEDVERRLLEATEKSRKLSLERYKNSLKCICYEEYQQKDEDMPDCSICLINFEPTDEIIVFNCDPKHYFHKNCGHEWLAVKTECPLCRFDF